MGKLLNLKADTTPCRSPERAALAEAIERREIARRDLAACERAIEAALHVRIAAREALENAEVEARKATNSAGRHLVSALLDAGTIGALTQRQARELLQDAEDGLAAALDASETLESELRSLRDSVSIADMIVGNRFRDVVMADPAVKQAFDAFKTAQRILIDARRPLEILASRRLIPHELRFWNHEDIHSSGGQDWLAALAALETDPDALLPSAGG